MVNDTSYIFFGTSIFSVYVLEELHTAGLTPKLIITTPDKPKGRKLVLTPPPVKDWAIEHDIPFLQPAKLSDPDFITRLSAEHALVFVVASYGKILPKSVLDLAPKGTLNVHPSLLPKLRGAAPLQTSILEDMKDTGVSIMLLDEEMDHGPIVAQEKATLTEWPTRVDILEELLGRQGGQLLAQTLPHWTEGSIEATPQAHNQATYTKKITKEDGLLDLSGDSYANFLKYNALYGWPGTYFFTERGDKKIRVSITDASYQNEAFIIKKVIPEGKREMSYEDFVRGSGSQK